MGNLSNASARQRRKSVQKTGIPQHGLLLTKQILKAGTCPCIRFLDLLRKNIRGHGLIKLNKGRETAPQPERQTMKESTLQKIIRAAREIADRYEANVVSGESTPHLESIISSDRHEVYKSVGDNRLKFTTTVDEVQKWSRIFIKDRLKVSLRFLNALRVMRGFKPIV